MDVLAFSPNRSPQNPRVAPVAHPPPSLRSTHHQWLHGSHTPRYRGRRAPYSVPPRRHAAKKCRPAAPRPAPHRPLLLCTAGIAPAPWRARHGRSGGKSSGSQHRAREWEQFWWRGRWRSSPSFLRPSLGCPCQAGPMIVKRARLPLGAVGIQLLAESQCLSKSSYIIICTEYGAGAQSPPESL